MRLERGGEARPAAEGQGSTGLRPLQRHLGVLRGGAGGRPRTPASACVSSGWPWTWAGVINPDGVINQVEGGAVQSASWGLASGSASTGPKITSVTLGELPDPAVYRRCPRWRCGSWTAPGEPETGAGELAQGPVAGAIGNAVGDAIGVRVRDLPLTTEQITRAMRGELTGPVRAGPVSAGPR